MYDQGPWHLGFKFNNLFNKPFLQLLSFHKFSVFCCVKTVKVDVDCYLKLVGGGGGF